MSDRISVRVPATSANLGCLFDCGAVALGLYLDMHVTPRPDESVTVHYEGVTPERVPSDESNLIVRIIRGTLESWKRRHGFDLHIDNQIPVAAGLGSSAAVIVGSLAVCHWLADLPLFDQELVTLATRLEGHPDNVAAAWLGGFTVAVNCGDRVLACSCPVPDPLQFVAVVPDYEVVTEKAREVLPNQYSRADAVHNLQRAAAMTAQFFAGKTDFDPSFFEDRWHQAPRASLVPGLSEVLQLKHPGLLGICLSGAGPSILAFVRGNGADVGELIRQTLAAHGVHSQPYLLSADNRGAKGWSLPT
jgi:homoserine kinase